MLRVARRKPQLIVPPLPVTGLLRVGSAALVKSTAVVGGTSPEAIVHSVRTGRCREVATVIESSASPAG